MEEVAEHYLAELTHRSLLQVIERNANGRPRTFVMHDLVREVTSITAEKEKFAVIHGHVGATQLSHNARRLCIQNSAHSQNYLGNSHLRSFILFDSLVPSSWIYDVSSHFRLLRVLSLRFTNIEQVPCMVTELYNLRYLDISYTKVKQIPASFRKLVHLQVLDLRFSYVEELPLEITMLTNLRHLHAVVVRDFQERSLNCFSATKIPGNICGLKNLQSLHTVSANNDLVSQLGKLTLMRSLTIMSVRLNMATGTYPMGTSHPHPHPPGQNLTRTRTRTRVRNSFHTRTRTGNSYPTGNPHPKIDPRLAFTSTDITTW
ncbi:hypothetical protein BDA96_10G321900 [Sorghum bicolor]|uniref:Uncharacterized protein n=1 Tax=Sorghum bicolor TaxID=4558 RepID=A0A921Q628_SORBI|nr:hypothetical protein BDA96_10G321900 [Sorghum bicolor]